MRFSSLTTFVVGIDPGTSTGFAILSRPKNLALLDSGTSNFFDIQSRLGRFFPDKSEVRIFVEVSPGIHISRKPLVRMPNETDKQFADREKREEQTRDKMLINTGGVQKEARLLCEALTRMGFEVETVVPIRGAKWTQTEFERYTGSCKRTNEHERDAVRLVMNYANKRELEDELFAKI